MNRYWLGVLMMIGGGALFGWSLRGRYDHAETGRGAPPTSRGSSDDTSDPTGALGRFTLSRAPLPSLPPETRGPLSSPGDEAVAASPAQPESVGEALPVTPAMAYVQSGLPKAVRERYEQLDRRDREVFADAAMGLVQRYKEVVNAWWVRAQNLSDEQFLHDDTLSRARLQLTKDLEALLP